MKSFSELTSASQVNNDDLLAISQTSGSGYASKKTTVKDITNKSNLNLAEEYDSTSTYAVDDYVIYESVLYKCIASTTGTFDSTKWTSVVVTDEMGSGGGGGTGGHTIIDENGNSMTARAGLQFVGGANVSDDSTNNKTIVDIASAGGIDGVFIDTNNEIANGTYSSSTPLSYTATEDCFAYVHCIMDVRNAEVKVYIDGEQVYIGFSNNTSMDTIQDVFTCYLKKGQVLTATTTRMDNASEYKIYGIQTGTTHSKFQPVIYSLEEREIGVWKDGKPLYQKTLNVASVGSVGSSQITPIQINDIPFDYIEVVEANIYDSNDNRRYILPNLSKNAVDQIFLHPYLDKSSNPVVFYASLYTGGVTYSNMIDFNVIIQYTKTTDVAGSGSWTPQGVPTHHYSEDEQVIGTWIDGKTLYEKTYDFSSTPISIPSGSNFMTSDIDSSNMGVVTNVFANHSDGTLYNDMSADPTGNNHTKLKLKSVGGATAYYLTLQYTKTS